MADSDIIKASGTTKASKPDRGGGNIREVPVFGIVKNNIDPTRSGRLEVYISDLGSEAPDQGDAWITVSYMPPFYGFVQPTAPDTGYGTFKANPASYGMWNSPPDIGSTVICIFINGDPNYGYWIGCVPKPEALYMVPAIAAYDKVITNETEAQNFGGATRLPVTNMNINNDAQTNSSGFLTEPKPVHSYQAMIFNQQGLIRDSIRGPIGSSAQRESPSRVGWGISTPGRPIYEGGFTDENIAGAAGTEGGAGQTVVSRRGGHSIVLDDGNMVGKDQLVRIRSALGHQITMSDDGQTIFIIHSNGQSWVELGKEGTIDMYATNSVNIRTQGDLNLHADRDINMHAAKKLNIHAESMNIETDKDTNHKIGTDYKISTKGKHTHKVDGPLSLSAGGEASLASTSTTFINGSRVNLNTGSTSTTPEEVPPLTKVAHTDTLYDQTKGFAAAPGKLQSIVSRAPAHSPWANANQGVDVKVDLNAGGALPSAPSGPLENANNAAESAPANAETSVTSAGAATVPQVNAISGALDKGTTQALVGAVAKGTATSSIGATLASAGTALTTNASGQVTAAVGQLGLTVNQLGTAGALKAGAPALVNSLLQQGVPPATALSSNMFTGAGGATNLSAVVNSVGIQTNAVVSNMQQAQTSLTKAGVLTGKESPNAMAGAVFSAATVGVNQTINAITNVTKTATGAVTNLIGGAASGLTGGISAVTKAFSAGNFAAGLAQNASGALGAISGALGSLSKSTGLGSLLNGAKGVVGSAFSAVTASFKPLQAGVPQDLTAIAANKAADNASTNLASAAGGALSGITKSVTGLIGGVTKTATSLVSGITSKITGSVSTIASGLNAIPGGQNAVSTIVNNSPFAKNSIPGTAGIGAMAQNASTAVNNGISSAQGLASSVQSSFAGVAGSIGAQAQQLAGSASSLIGSATDKLGSAGNSLATLATKGLPASAVNELNASIASLSAGGSNPLKLPTIAENTIDRSSIQSQITSLLGDPAIPAPSFGAPSESAQAEYDQIVASNEEISNIADQLLELQDQIDSARIRVNIASNDLPKGDPIIQSTTDEYLTLLNEYEALKSKANDYLG